MLRRELLKSGVSLASAFGLFSPSASLEGDQTAKASFIDAYPDRLSYNPGEEVSLQVSTKAREYSLEVARVGAQREVVWSKAHLPGAYYPAPDDAAVNGCRWPAALKIPIGKDWRSGYYSVSLSAPGRDGVAEESDAFFVVRPAQPGRNSHILLQLCTNTYNAYNNWGGACLYESGPLPLHGARVSFERPIARGFLSKPKGPLSKWADCAGWHNWEFPFVEWAEKA